MIRHFKALSQLALGGILSLTALGCTADQQSQLTEPPLGLWVWSADESRDPIRLRVKRAGSTLSATAAGQSVPLTVNTRGFSIELDAGHRFEGQISRDGQHLSGLWIQPSSRLGYQVVATPTDLTPEEPNVWSGLLRGQPRPYRVYLDVFRNANDALYAVIRNPERNDIQRATRFRLRPSDSQRWVLTAGSGDRTVQRFLKRGSAGNWLLEFDRFEEPIPLRRASDDDRDAYDSLTQKLRETPTTAPPQLEDGWITEQPSRLGFDEAALEALRVEIAAADPRSPQPEIVHALLIARKGKLVFEEYFHGYDATSVHDIRSLGKMFAPILVGALQQQGASIAASDRPLPAILSAAGRKLEDQRKAEITLSQLMSYTSGLDCDDNAASPGNEETLWTQTEQADFWLYAATLPMAHDPGTRFAYCSASINLTGAAIRSASDDTVLNTFDRLVARPLGFADNHWNLMPNGEAYLGGGAYLRARDLLKIGAMQAAGGRWDDTRILSERWVREASTPVIAVSPETTGMDDAAFANAYFPSQQAYAWRAHDITVDDRRYRSYENTGNGGQVLVIVPELELAVTFLGGNYGMGYIWGRWRDKYVGERIIHALRNP